MKEATGEFSTTVIVLVAVGLISLLFGTVLYPMIRNGIVLNAACNNNQGTSFTNDDGSKIDCTELNNGVYTCKYTAKGADTTTASKVCK